MSISIIVATVLFCFYLFQYISEKEKAEKEEDQSFQELMNGEHKDEDDMKERKCLDERTIAGLVLTTLRKIGCDPETEEHNNLNYAYFTFQGEKFTIESNDTCKFITIYDTWWHSISIYSDVEEIANLHKTINLVNQYVNCTLLYTTNKDIEEIGVHSRRTILFIKEIPEIDNYLICVLNDFFKAQRLVLTELEKCKVTEV
jgi:hypothetical protein